MDAGKRTINDIVGSNKLLEIPFFQRSYVWGEPQWERFLEDIENVCASMEQYFMGALILKQQLVSSGMPIGNVRMIIDGQQRLTTLSLLLKVLSLKTGESQLFRSQFITYDGRPVIQHNHNDEAVFNEIMMMGLDSNGPGQTGSASPEDGSQSDGGWEKLPETTGIAKAYNYFLEHVDPQKLNYHMICNLILFVGIDLDYNEDEQQIFDTINSLGVRLTTAELLKNYFFGRENVDAFMKNWSDIFEKDAETRAYWDREITTGRVKRTYIDLFFYSFLQIKIQDNTYHVSAEDKLRFSRLERLFESYKAFIKKYANDNKAEILQEIRGYAPAFRNAISYDVLEEDLPGEAGIERINAVIFSFDTTTLIPYVLYIEKNVTDEAARKEMYEYLESYIVRRVITRETTKNYNRLFSERLILNRVLSKRELVQALSDSEDTTNRMPADEEVVKGFHESELINKYAAGVLYLIESKIRNRKMQAVQLLGIRQYSLEHLMPKKWRNHWSFEGSPEEAEKRDHILLTLGNLTIISASLNASIRDADWETKKAGKGYKGGLRKYAEGIEILSGYLGHPVWDEGKINERADYLARNALEIWKA